MFRNSHNSKGLSTNARRWRTVLIALVLALTFGSANQPAQAQEGGLRYILTTRMKTSTPKEICLGATGSITVQLIRNIVGSVLQTNISFDVSAPRPGIAVYAISQDPGIASLRAPSQITIGFEPDRPLGVEFVYRGNKAGTTTIEISTDKVSRLAGEYFDNPTGIIASDKFKSPVSVRVASCKFEVTAVSTFEVPGMKVVAVIDKAVMRTDAPGHYIGTAKVKWTGFWDDLIVPETTCKHKLTASVSDAYLQGTLDESGFLVMDVSYQAQSGSWKINCGGPIQTQAPFKLDPTPLLNIAVPLSYGLEEKLLQSIERCGVRYTSS